MGVRAGIRLRPSALERHSVPRRGVDASIRSIAYTNAFATRPAVPPLSAGVLPHALHNVPLFFRRSTGSPMQTEHTPLSLGVFMLQHRRPFMQRWIQTCPQNTNLESGNHVVTKHMSLEMKRSKYPVIFVFLNLLGYWTGG